MRLPRAVTGAGTDAASWRLIVRATSRACFAKRPRPPRTARRAEKAVRHAAFVRSYPLTLLPRPRSARRKSPTVIDGCAPESLVRTRLPAGGRWIRTLGPREKEPLVEAVCSTFPALPFREGPRVRIHLPPAVSQCPDRVHR